MNRADMVDKNRTTPNRIPVRFVDSEGEREPETGTADPDTGLTADELGRASIYEDATEMQRRIDRGGEEDTAEGRDRADDADTAGAPDYGETDESREDLDSTPSLADPEEKSGPIEGGEARQAAAAGPLMAELVATRAELRRVEGEMQKFAEERQEWTDRLARRQAEFDNFRKRSERERGETYNRALADVVSRFLPVLDNLRRALDAEGSVKASESEEFRHFLQGVELISKQLNGVLESLGVEAVPTVGQPFDPHVHEAVATEETDRFDPDIVMEEMQRGYRLAGKLLRPAMVKVATRQ